MSQLTGPVGLGPIDPYYYSGEYEKEEEKKRAAEQLEQEMQVCHVFISGREETFGSLR